MDENFGFTGRKKRLPYKKRVFIARAVSVAVLSAIVIGAFCIWTAVYMRKRSGTVSETLFAPDNADREVASLAVGDIPVPFVADLSEFEEYMNPDTDEYLFLVNSEHTLPETYAPFDLVAAPNVRQGYGTLYMREYAAKALAAMMTEAQANGFKVGAAADGKTLSVISAYRSYAKQKSNFERALNSYLAQGYSYDIAYKLTCEYYALPGSSEHQTGLCCDITTQVGDLNDDFANTDIAVWLAENAHRFGFILRYPKGREDSTGINFEPWHFRYVGRKYATEIYESGQTLEEYMSGRES